MKNKNKILSHIFRFFCSLKLACVLIVILLLLLSVGTFVESKYNAEAAKTWVYKSGPLYSLFSLLVLNLLCVMLSRWPWKKRHTGFLLAHIGLIVIIVGSFFTHQWGVDGSILLPIGKSNQFVSLMGKTVSIHSSFNGESYSLIYSQDVNFFASPPEKYPLLFQLKDGKELRITHHHPFTLLEEKIVPSSNLLDGPAIRFQIWGSKVKEVNWMIRSPTQTHTTLPLGLSRITLSDGSYKHQKGHELILETTTRSESHNQKKIRYKVYKDSPSFHPPKASQSGKAPPSSVFQSGWIQEGETFQTPWMDLKFRLLRYHPHAKIDVSYLPLKRETDQSVPAISFSFDGQTHTLGLNSFLRLFTEKEMYVISFSNKRLKLDFELQLKEFKMTYDPGTKNPASYESHLNIPGHGDVTVSMNHPLKHKGFTFYQSSFQENEKKEISASILSVNKDPGRLIKYFGSFLVVLGSFVLFYLKPSQKNLRRKKKDLP